MTQPLATALEYEPTAPSAGTIDVPTLLAAHPRRKGSLSVGVCRTCGVPLEASIRMGGKCRPCYNRVRLHQYYARRDRA
jgi:hypothetical protein